MYFCINCNGEFEKPKKEIERHGFSEPPYEEFSVCPFCKSIDIIEIHSVYCKCCGIKLKSNKSNYCSKECENKWIKLMKMDLKRKKEYYNNPLNSLVRELKEYNKNNNTELSYGQYIAYIKTKRTTD